MSLITLDNLGGSIKIPYKDKMVHFVFYFVFVLLWSYYRKSIRFSSQHALLILAIAIGFGILMELCQGAFTTTRNPDILDALANSIGAFSGFLIVKNFANKRKI